VIIIIIIIITIIIISEAPLPHIHAATDARASFTHS